MNDRKMSLNDAFRYIYKEKGKQVFSDAKLLGAMLTDLVDEDKNLIPFIVQSSTNHYFDFLARCSNERIRQAVDDAVKKISADYQDVITGKIEAALYYTFNLGTPAYINKGNYNTGGSKIPSVDHQTQNAAGTAEKVNNINHRPAVKGFAVLALILAAAVIAAALFVIRPWQKNTAAQSQQGLETLPTDVPETEAESAVATEEPLARTDLTDKLSDITLLHDELHGIERKEAGEYAHWYQDFNDQFGYGSYEETDTVDRLWFISDQYEVFDLYIGQEIEEGVEILNRDAWLLDNVSGYSSVLEKDDLSLTLSVDADDKIQQIELNRTVVQEQEHPETSSSSGSNTVADSSNSETKSDDSYFFPNSLDELLSESQLYGMSARELTLARNEIFARYGYTFKRQDLQEYFNTKSWYHADPNVNPDTISSIVGKTAMKNMVMIREYQKRTGLTY